MSEEKKIILDKILNELCRQKNVPGARVARELGINRATFHNWMNGAVPRSLESFNKLSRYFDVSLDFLFFGEEKKIENENNGKKQKIKYVITIERLE